MISALGFWLLDVYSLATCVLAVSLLAGGRSRATLQVEQRVRGFRAALFAVSIGGLVAALPVARWSVGDYVETISVSGESIWIAVLTGAAAAPVWLGWLFLGAWGARRLIGQGAPAPEWVRRLAPHPTRVLVSGSVEHPLAVGCWRPRVLLPQRWIEEGRIECLRAALWHECEHIRRGDVVVLAVCRGLSVVLFAHPLFWIVRKRLAADQELLADGAAVKTVDRLEYARMLVEWARESRAPQWAHALAAAARRASLLRTRVEQLLNPDISTANESHRALAVIAALLVLFSLVTWRPAIVWDGPVLARMDQLDTTVSPRKSLAERRNEIATGPWLISLEPGVDVELLGVADRFAESAHWWSPSGQPLDCLPSESRFLNLGDGREAIVRWTEANDALAAERVSGLTADVSLGVLRLGRGDGHWVDRHVVAVADGFACGGMDVSWCDDTDDVCVTVGGSAADEEIRVVAIDSCGDRFEAEVLERGGGEITVSFKNLPLDAVDEIVVQTRPLHWVEVPNVALSPEIDA